LSREPERDGQLEFGGSGKSQVKPRYGANVDRTDSGVKSAFGPRPGVNGKYIESPRDGNDEETRFVSRGGGRSHSLAPTDSSRAKSLPSIPRSEKMGGEPSAVYPPRGQVSQDTGRYPARDQMSMENAGSRVDNAGGRVDSGSNYRSRDRQLDNGKTTDISGGYPARDRTLDSSNAKDNAGGYSQRHYDRYGRYRDGRYGDDSTGRWQNGQYDDVSGLSRPIAVDNHPVAIEDQQPTLYDAGPSADPGRYYGDSRDPGPAVVADPSHYYGDGRDPGPAAVGDPGRYYGDGGHDLYRDVVYSPGDYYYNAPVAPVRGYAGSAAPADYDFYNSDVTGLFSVYDTIYFVIKYFISCQLIYFSKVVVVY